LTTGLPSWSADGFLPDGVHASDLSGIYDRFVVDAPHRAHREVLFGALTTYLTLVQRLIPSGRAWIDGGFGTVKAAAPHDVDVAVHPADWNELAALPEQDQADLLGLLTHQDLIIGSLGPA
jgi:hypothetical protein